MERMEMHSRNEYLKVLRERYFKAKTKKEKSQILDEYYHKIMLKSRYFTLGLSYFPAYHSLNKSG